MHVSNIQIIRTIYRWDDTTYKMYNVYTHTRIHTQLTFSYAHTHIHIHSDVLCLSRSHTHTLPNWDTSTNTLILTWVHARTPSYTLIPKEILNFLFALPISLPTTISSLIYLGPGCIDLCKKQSWIRLR